MAKPNNIYKFLLAEDSSTVTVTTESDGVETISSDKHEVERLTKIWKLKPGVVKTVDRSTVDDAKDQADSIRATIRANDEKIILGDLRKAYDHMIERGFFAYERPAADFNSTDPYSFKAGTEHERFVLNQLDYFIQLIEESIKNDRSPTRISDMRIALSRLTSCLRKDT